MPAAVCFAIAALNHNKNARIAQEAARANLKVKRHTGEVDSQLPLRSKQQNQAERSSDAIYARSDGCYGIVGPPPTGCHGNDSAPTVITESANILAGGTRAMVLVAAVRSETEAARAVHVQYFF
eukprot:SAG31_NODE_6349_length_2052_cov_1.828469_1_plen_124_part_00